MPVLVTFFLGLPARSYSVWVTVFLTLSSGRFGITFPQFAKIDVNGKNEDPLYTYLKSKKGGLFSSRIKWNFTKFLVGKDGTVIKRFGPTETPESIEAFVKNALA